MPAMRPGRSDKGPGYKSSVITNVQECHKIITHKSPAEFFKPLKHCHKDNPALVVCLCAVTKSDI